MTTGAAGTPVAGLQPERTGLAWSRTGLALAANALLALRAGVVHEQPVVLAVGAALLLAAAFVVAFGFARRHRLARGGIEAAGPAAMMAIAVLAGLASAAALAPLLTFVR